MKIEKAASRGATPNEGTSPSTLIASAVPQPSGAVRLTTRIASQPPAALTAATFSVNVHRPRSTTAIWTPAGPAGTAGSPGQARPTNTDGPAIVWPGSSAGVPSPGLAEIVVPSTVFATEIA